MLVMRVLACIFALLFCGGWTHGAVCTPALVAVGDSLTLATTPTLLTSYEALIGTALNVTAFNEGVNSIGWNFNPGGGSLTTIASTQVDPLRTSAPCPPPFLVLFAGTNDIFAGGSTGAQTVGFFQTYITARQSAGWSATTKTVVVTMLPRTGVSETDRTAYNNGLISNAATFGYALARMDLDANMGCAGCQTNLTYYQNDGTHPNQTGQQVIANTVCLAMGFSSGQCPAY
jgi:lysophospholipase L1-like esterase